MQLCPSTGCLGCCLWARTAGGSTRGQHPKMVWGGRHLKAHPIPTPSHGQRHLLLDQNLFRKSFLLILVGKEWLFPQDTRGRFQNQHLFEMHLIVTWNSLAGCITGLKHSQAWLSLPLPWCGHQFSGWWGKSASLSLPGFLVCSRKKERKRELNLCSWYHSAFSTPMVKL